MNGELWISFIFYLVVFLISVAISAYLYVKVVPALYRGLVALLKEDSASWSLNKMKKFVARFARGS